MAMQPMRSGGNMFGRGGPLSTATAAAKLAIAVIAASVIAALVPGLQQWLGLVPGLATGTLGNAIPALWQPLTYIPLAFEPFGVLIGALIVWSIGGSLEQSWGRRRFLSFTLGATAVSGLLTAILALLWPSLRGALFGGATVMVTAVWLAYGWSFGAQKLQMMFVGAVSGNAFAIFGILLVGIKAAFARSLVPVMPELFAILCAYVYVKVGSPRVLVLKARQWQLQRELKSRSKHLRVISDDRNTDKGSDRFIH